MKPLILTFLLTFSTLVFADNSSGLSNHNEFFDISELNNQEMACYTLAMIGFDSVVNKSNGTSHDSVFGMLMNHIVGDPVADHNIPMLRAVLGGFTWSGSPHTYAIKTFGGCMARS